MAALTSSVAVIAQASRPAQQARSAAVASVSPKNAFGARAQAVLPSKKRGTAAYRGRSLVVKANNAAAPTKVTIVDAAIADPQFSVLVEAVVKAQLATALSGGSFTVFAPTNDAFTKALGALKLTKAQLLALPNLAEVLKFHVVPGKVMSSQLKQGMEATTLEGSKIKFDLSSGVKVNGASVIKADIEVDNGVIHVIDTVILPPVKPSEFKAAMPGISLPLGFFDPLNFTDGQSVDEIKRLRESEITHGRLAMLAAVGFFVNESFNPLFNGEITGLAINMFQQVPSPFWEVVVLFIGIAEAGRATKGWQEPSGETMFKLRPSYTPGDLGFDPLGLKPTNAADYKEMATKEINNGRLAMLAVAGFVAQEEATGLTLMEQLTRK